MPLTSCRSVGENLSRLCGLAGLVSGAVLVLTCAQAQAARGGPDDYGYTWVDSTEGDGPTFDFVPGYNPLTELDDDDLVTVDIGFTFTYLEQGYAQVDVHSNGALSFGASGPIGHDHDCSALVPDIQGTSDPLDVPVLLPYWIDLDPSDSNAGAVYTATTGVEPNRVLIVEWYEIPPYSDSNFATFEVKLFEADGAIEFHYQDLDVGGDGKDNGGASAIGISAEEGHYFPVSCDSTAIVGPGVAVRFEPPCADEDGDGVTVCDDDCDDTNPDVYPGAEERCNGEDEDCDGVVPADEVDWDGDGAMICDGDCDDTDLDVYPGALELCNGEDDDCDGVVPGDEDDEDGDSWLECDGDCDDTDPAMNDLDEDDDGETTCEGDCDDQNDMVRSDGLEQCDGLDNDCDGEIDENPNCGGDDDDGADDDDDTDPPGWDIPYGCIMDCAHAQPSGNGAPGLALVCLLAAGFTLRRSRRQ